MKEGVQLRKSLIKLLIAGIFAVLYSLGGMEHKWLRRFLAPFILCGGTFYFSKDWRSLISFPVMCLSLSLGYGADETITKIIKRGVFGLANGISTSLLNIIRKKYAWALFQVILLVSAYIIFGVWGLVDARTEELFLGFLVAFLFIMSA